MDDGEDLFVGLALIVVLICGGILIWALVQLCQWIADHPEESKRIAQAALLIVTAPVWLPPVATARVLLAVFRDVPVRCWRFFEENNPRDMVIFWVVELPLAVGFGFAIGALILAMARPDFISPLVLVYVPLLFVAVLASYYGLYFWRPLHHPNWPIFIAAEEALWFDIRSSIVLQRYRLRLWLSAPRRAIRRRLGQGA